MEGETLVSLARGTVVVVDLDPTVGHEQRGLRPAVIVSDPVVVEDQRFPLIGVVPVTGTPGTGALYPQLDAGASGLRKTSYALVDQVRSVDKRRVRRRFGVIAAADLTRIEDGLRLYLGP
jgi:mRNA interferase MazF